MSNCMYEFTVKEKGYVEAEKYTTLELSKLAYVKHYLQPALHYSRCGWNAVEYKVMKTPIGHRTEFLILWTKEIGQSGSRWINVTGNSLGAIMCEMCDNLW